MLNVSPPAILSPNSCVILDFGKPVIKDHLGNPDLRVVRAPVDKNISVEVSNDRINWESCERDKSRKSGFEEYDVPYWNSPWRYVRICNKSKSNVSIFGVYDLY